MSSPIHILKEVFGYEEFRPDQEQVISSVLEGHDNLVIMPTGGGKSLCFQIPGLFKEGITLVISPLISLMRDQVDALKANGIKAAYFNSSLSSSEETEVRSLAESGQLKFLYIAPERLIGLYQGWLSNLDVNLVAIDEAHCVSMWGHDFRPEYTQLKAVRSHWNSIPFIALTATADKVTRNDIIEQLGLRSTHVSISSFDRSNLSLATRGGVPQKQKFKEISDFIKYRPNQSGIIYCLSRKDTENLANYLQGSGIQAAPYHAGLDSALRSRVQDNFIKEKIPIVVATIAFGMGIDKSNVRFVIHSSLPKNIEGYYQEIGRAGRDGMPSDTLMYYNWKDFILLKRFADESAHQELNLEKLQRIFDYGESVNCRRQTILSYFGEEHGGNCGNCDNCLQPAELFDGTILAQKALSAAYRVEQKVGTNMMIAILRGSAPAELIAKGYHEIKTYGAGRDLSFRDWKHYLVQMINQGIFEVAYKDSFSLKISKLGVKALKGQHQVLLSKFKETLQADGTDATRKKRAKWEAIFEQLKALRTELAEKLDVLPHNIFNDATLKEISIVKPRNRQQLERISGVSSHKADIYGDSFLSVFTSRKKKKGLSNSTYMKTFGLWKNGMTPEEIANERGVQSTTIYSHIARLYLEDKIKDISMLVNPDQIQKIRKSLSLVQSTDKLKPIYEGAKGDVPYHLIRLALAHIEKEDVHLQP